jgi:hypothetical protein
VLIAFMLAIAVSAAEVSKGADQCPDLEAVITNVDDACWRAVAEDELRATATGGDTIENHVHIMPPELVGSEDFPFQFTDPDGLLAKRCFADRLSSSKSDVCEKQIRKQCIDKGVPEEACKGRFTERLFELMRPHLQAALRTFVTQYRRFRSSDGYGKTRWGMTPAEVRLVVRGLPASGPTVKKDTVAGRSALVAYAFADGRLYAVVVAFTDPHIGPQQYLDDFGQITAILAAKYGEPQQNEIVFNSAATHDALADEPAMAIRTGAAKAVAVWNHDKTTITATCAASDPLRVTNVVTYESGELAEWAEKRVASNAAKDL